MKRTIASGEVNINGRPVPIECYVRCDGRQVVKVGKTPEVTRAASDHEPFDFRAELKAELERVRRRR